MSISVQCPGCEKKLKSKDELSGKRVKCPGCGHIIVIPAAQAVSQSKAISPPQGKSPVPNKAGPASEPMSQMLGNMLGAISAAQAAPASSPLPVSGACDRCNGSISKGEGYSFFSSASMNGQLMGNMLLCEDCTAKIMTPEHWQKEIPKQRELSGADILANPNALLDMMHTVNADSIVQCCKKRGLTPEQAKVKARDFAKRWWNAPEATQRESAQFWLSGSTKPSKTGLVPIRPTPLDGEQTPSATKDGFQVPADIQKSLFRFGAGLSMAALSGTAIFFSGLAYFEKSALELKFVLYLVLIWIPMFATGCYFFWTTPLRKIRKRMLALRLAHDNKQAALGRNNVPAKAKLPNRRQSDSRDADLSRLDIARGALEMVPESVARENAVIPIYLAGNKLRIAIADTSDGETIDKLRFILNCDIEPVAARREEIEQAIDRWYGQAKATATPPGSPTAASAKALPLSWTREGQSHDERLRAQHGGFGEMKAILNIDDFGRNQNPSEFRVLASSLSFNNGVLSGDVPGDLSGNKACHVCATVGEHKDALTTFRNNIEGGKMFLRSCFHKYPQYPLIHFSIMLPLDKAADLTKVRATVVEQVVNYVNADFQDWVHGLYKTRKTLIHVYGPDHQRLATGTVNVDLDPSFMNDLVQAMNDAEAALQKIAVSKRDYSASVKTFYQDHPAPFVCPMRKK